MQHEPQEQRPQIQRGAVSRWCAFLQQHPTNQFSRALEMDYWVELHHIRSSRGWQEDAGWLEDMEWSRQYRPVLGPSWPSGFKEWRELAYKRFWCMNRILAFKIWNMEYFWMISRATTQPCVRGSLSKAEIEDLELKRKLWGKCLGTIT